MTTCFKLFLIVSMAVFFSCSNNGASADKKDSSASATTAKSLPLPADSMTRDALFSFVDGCIVNFKVALGEEKAYGFCKCMYEQFRVANPDADSTKLKAMVNDTAQIEKMAANCR